MLPGAIKEFQVILEKYLTAHNLASRRPCETYGAPRRLVASCCELSRQAAGRDQGNYRSAEVRLPLTLRENRRGRPRALRKRGTSGRRAVRSCRLRRGISRREASDRREPAKEILEEILPRAVAEIPWPRSMYWTGATGLHFIRPIRWVVALLGGKRHAVHAGRCRRREFTVRPPISGQSKIPVRGRQRLRAKA